MFGYTGILAAIPINNCLLGYAVGGKGPTHRSFAVHLPAHSGVYLDQSLVQNRPAGFVVVAGWSLCAPVG